MRKIFLLVFALIGLIMFPATTLAAPADTKNVKIAVIDTDKDYLSDAWEKIIGTDSADPDSDGDKFLDGTEVKAGFDPLSQENKTVPKTIKVDLKTQHLWYYFGDKLLADFPISSGLRSTPTPKGEFTVLDKVLFKRYGGPGYNFDFPNTKWNLHFATKKLRYYIHGAYWHNKFGRPMSHGCVNVSYANMETLYWFAQTGTKVIIN
jgi:lipoprotein-anchoring transpeptidase ErfK/SrfK